MKYKVIENFFDENFCKKLIEDAEKYSNDDHIKVLNERLLLPSTSLSYLKLLNNSQNWFELHKNLNSQNFLNTLIDSLGIKDDKFHVTNFFFNYKPDNFLSKYKELNAKKISTIGNFGLFFYLFYKFYRSTKRIIKYSFIRKNYVELLYDYSKSPNGYKREIHRDSDSRTIVFLIYLNSLSSKGSGGDLRLYKFNDENKKIPSRPLRENCTILETIPPKPGRLVTFLNSHDSLHDVDEMRNHDGYRHFLYGSFTLLGKKNPLIKNSEGNLKTNFNIFD